MKFIEINRGYPKASDVLPNEDFARYPCEISKELGLSSELWALNSGRLPNSEVINGVKVKRFRSSLHLFLHLFGNDIKLIHSFLRPHMPSLLAGFINKPKIFTTVSYELGSTKLIKMVSLFLLKRFDKIICITPYELEVYKKNGINPKKLVFLPLAIDYDFFSERASNKLEIMKKYDLPQEDFKIITIANFRAFKNLDIMIKAFEIFNKLTPNSTFIIIGQDFLKANDIYREQKKVNQSVNSLIGDNNNIKWVGGRTPHEIRELLNISDVYVSSSSVEAQGLTNYEAAATGIAMCLSNIGSFTSVFKNDVLYHGPYDYNSLADNFMKYYKDAQLRKRNGLKVRDLVKSWDFKIISEKLKSLYVEVLKNHTKLEK